MAKKNEYVRIHRSVLEAVERTGKLPEDTKSVPLEMWVKGWLQDEEAQIGDTVTVEISPYDLGKGRITYRHKI